MDPKVRKLVLLGLESYTQMRNEEKCICDRGTGLVTCKFCGFFTKGRVAIPCGIHKNVMFLMDISQCPNCRNFHLEEINPKIFQKKPLPYTI